jgi:hypothetical protein
VEQLMFDMDVFLEELRRSLADAARRSPPTFAVVTLAEAAAQLEVSVDEVRRMISCGQLLCTVVAHETLISVAEIERAQERRLHREGESDEHRGDDPTRRP